MIFRKKYRITVDDPVYGRTTFERLYRTKIGARRAIVACAKIDWNRYTIIDFPYFWLRRNGATLFAGSNKHEWTIERV